MDIQMTPLGPALDVGPLLLPLLVIAVIAGGFVLVAISALRDARSVRAQLDRLQPAASTADLDDERDDNAGTGRRE